MTRAFKVTCITIAAIIWSTPAVVQAHSGRTNAQGCHTNRSTGEHHCHGGRSGPRLPYESGNAGSSRSARPSGAFANCAAARAAGAAPVRRGEPGYGAPLDRDNDGIGCER